MIADSRMGNITHAAVGIMQRDDGWVLLGQRPVGKPWSGYWEFPGGKVEDQESPAHALVRELQEELGITPDLFYPWLVRTYDYPAKFNSDGSLNSVAKTVKLHFFIVTRWQGVPSALEQQQLSWQNPRQVEVEPMLPANAPILAALNLPRVYAISNLLELGEEAFFKRLHHALEHGLKMIQVREKHLSVLELKAFAIKLVKLVSAYDAKVFINSNEPLATEIDAAGVHFTSAQLMSLKAKPEGLLCGAACHNLAELGKAAQLGLDYVTLSPVNQTLSHPGADALGWPKFSQWLGDYPIPVYALGGMQMDDLDIARQHGAHGIALQRAVWNVNNLFV